MAYTILPNSLQVGELVKNASSRAKNNGKNCRNRDNSFDKRIEVVYNGIEISNG